ncbi:aryl hydrocarbon receptor 2 isoform X2 [Scyliorhinus canicula]|uniref:aryl hydrocarbon receptor 2 isoform X2 n=1 Tax=Scyliorhinus canicula TaxID=7830 RepID=UPI0018F58D8A|nr:aryl hydrocarbon receptor 2 isoform X2 [Scyliorhinus canicula]
MLSAGGIYAVKKRKKPVQKSPKPPPADGVKSNPSKRHRDRLNCELDKLTSLLPFGQDVRARLDKLSVLRLSVGYLKAKSFFNASMKRKKGPWLTDKPAHCPGNGQQNGQLSEGDLLLEALNGFILVVTAEGYVFYTSSTIQDYLGFHQSDVVHQSVFELIHTDDRAMFRHQLHWALNPPACQEVNPRADIIPENSSLCSSVINYNPHDLPPENSSFMKRNFICRFRCLLDNSSGFLTLNFQGRLKFLHGQNKKAEDSVPIPPQLALFAVATPLQPPSILEVRTKTLIFQTKHKLDFTPLAVDTKGKFVLGYTETELCMRGTGYQFIHAADMMYCADSHVRMIKTGESGMTVFRLLTKQSSWVWVQANARLVYKGGRPDTIICKQRPLSNEEGEEHLRKRAMQLPFSFATGEAVLYEINPLLLEHLESFEAKGTSGKKVSTGENGTDQKNGINPSSLLGAMMVQNPSAYSSYSETNFNIDNVFANDFAVLNVPGDFWQPANDGNSSNKLQPMNLDDPLSTIIDILSQKNADENDLCDTLENLDVDVENTELEQWEETLMKIDNNTSLPDDFNDMLTSDFILSCVEDMLTKDGLKAKNFSQDSFNTMQVNLMGPGQPNPFGSLQQTSFGSDAQNSAMPGCQNSIPTDHQTLMMTNPQTPMMTNPQTPMMTNPQTPMMTNPQTPMMTNPQTPMMTNPQTPMMTNPQTPMMTNPQTPMMTNPQTPMMTNPQTPMMTNPQTPMMTNPQTPMMTNPQTPMMTNPQTPMMTNPQTPMMTNPQTPMMTNPQITMMMNPQMCHSQTPIMTHPQTPIMTHAQTPIMTHPQTSIKTHPQTSMTSHPPTPMMTHPQTSMTSHPPTPMMTNPQTPMMSHPPTPMMTNPQTPMMSHPPTPMMTNPQTPIMPNYQTPVMMNPQTPMMSQPQTPMRTGPQTPMMSAAQNPVLLPPQDPTVTGTQDTMPFEFQNSSTPGPRNEMHPGFQNPLGSSSQNLLGMNMQSFISRSPQKQIISTPQKTSCAEQVNMQQMRLEKLPAPWSLQRNLQQSMRQKSQYPGLNGQLKVQPLTVPQWQLQMQNGQQKPTQPYQVQDCVQHQTPGSSCRWTKASEDRVSAARYLDQNNSEQLPYSCNVAVQQRTTVNQLPMVLLPSTNSSCMFMSCEYENSTPIVRTGLSFPDSSPVAPLPNCSKIKVSSNHSPLQATCYYDKGSVNSVKGSSAVPSGERNIYNASCQFEPNFSPLPIAENSVCQIPTGQGPWN